MIAGLDLCAPFSTSSVLGTWRVVKKSDSWKIRSLSFFVFGREEKIDSIALEWSPGSKKFIRLLKMVLAKTEIELC